MSFTRMTMPWQNTSCIFAALSFFLSLILGAVLFENLATYDIRLFALACIALAVAMYMLTRLLRAGFRKLRGKETQENVQQL